jgi:hypothetical protein
MNAVAAQLSKSRPPMVGIYSDQNVYVEPNVTPAFVGNKIVGNPATPGPSDGVASIIQAQIAAGRDIAFSGAAAIPSTPILFQGSTTVGGANMTSVVTSQGGACTQAGGGGVIVAGSNGNSPCNSGTCDPGAPGIPGESTLVQVSWTTGGGSGSGVLAGAGGGGNNHSTAAGGSN